MFYKKTVLKNFVTFTVSRFNKVAGLKTYKFIKKRLQYRCFLVNIVKVLKVH